MLPVVLSVPRHLGFKSTAENSSVQRRYVSLSKALDALVLLV